jgi:hypothetical protein
LPWGQGQDQKLVDYPFRSRYEVKVNKQVLVVFFYLGKYYDEVLCGVMSMQVSHLFLGRPWQYDKRAMNNGVKNRYSFEMHGKLVTLVSLKPNKI